MWPFSRAKTLSQLEAERFHEIAEVVSGTWVKFYRQHQLDQVTPFEFEKQFLWFSVKAVETLRLSNFAVRQSDDLFFMTAVAAGVARSATNPKDEIIAVSGIQLSEWHIWGSGSFPWPHANWNDLDYLGKFPTLK